MSEYVPQWQSCGWAWPRARQTPPHYKRRRHPAQCLILGSVWRFLWSMVRVVAEEGPLGQVATTHDPHLTGNSHTEMFVTHERGTGSRIARDLHTGSQIGDGLREPLALGCCRPVRMLGHPRPACRTALSSHNLLLPSIIPLLIFIAALIFCIVINQKRYNGSSGKYGGGEREVCVGIVRLALVLIVAESLTIDSKELVQGKYWYGGPLSSGCVIVAGCL